MCMQQCYNNAQSLNPVTVVHDLMKAVDKCLHYVQITGECSFTVHFLEVIL